MRPEYTKENKEKIKRVEEYIGSVRTWSTPSESEIILSWPLEFVESEIGDRRSAIGDGEKRRWWVVSFKVCRLALSSQPNLPIKSYLSQST